MDKLTYIFGAGMLGQEMHIQGGENTHLFPRHKLDISNWNAVKYFMENKEIPKVIINCAAMTNVDECEIAHRECIRNNLMGAINLAKYAQQINALYVFISTDFVFDGKKDGPYYEREDKNAINMYGSSKQLAEYYIHQECEKILVVRTSTVFSSTKGFVRNVVNKIQDDRCKTIHMYPFVRNPTNVRMLAENIYNQIERRVLGTIHIVGKEIFTMDNFTRLILEEYSNKIEKVDIEVITTELYPFTDVAKRPVNSSLVTSEFIIQRKEMREVIREIMEEIRLNSC